MFKIAGGQLLNISWLEYVDLFAVGVSAGKWGQWTWCPRPVQPYRTFSVLDPSCWCGINLSALLKTCDLIKLHVSFDDALAQ